MKISEYLKEDKTKLEIVSGGISLGFPFLDQEIGGLMPGNIVSIIAKTGTGKTWMMLNILNCIAKKYPEKQICFHTLDMSNLEIRRRMAQIILGKCREDVKEALDEYERQYADTFKNVEFLDETVSATRIDGGLSRMNNYGKKLPDILFIDYFGLLMNEGKGNSQSSPYQIATENMKKIKEMAAKYKILFFLNHQVSRSSRPSDGSSGDLLPRDSGVIEEMSDFILGLKRFDIDDTKKVDERFKGKMFNKLQKNKNGRTMLDVCSLNNITGKIIELGDRAFLEMAEHADDN